MTRISVVIPSYNVSAFLPQAIASVRAQTRPVHEVIVVDDGSTDGSQEVARQLGATILATPANAGPSAARNLGVRAAAGDVIAFLDGDDYWEPTHCAETVALLERYSEAVLAFGGVRKFSDRPAAVRHDVRPPRIATAPPGQPSDAFWALVDENIILQSAAVVRRAALLEAGGYNEAMRHSEDYDLWFRLALRAPFVAAPAITTNYRIHEGQVSRSSERMVRGWWTARARARAAAASRWPPEVCEQLDDALRRAWEADLRWAWRTGDQHVLDVVLAQHASVPGSAELRARWQKRRRRFWSLWVPAVTVWDSLPQGTKNVLKLPVRALWGSP